MSQEEKVFSKEESLRAAFEIFKNNLVFLVLLTILWVGIINIPINIASGLMQAGMKGATPEETASSVAKFSGFVAIYMPLVIIWSLVAAPGIYRIALKLTRGSQAKLSEIITDKSTIFRFAVASIILIIGASIGLIFLIVPGVYILIRSQFYGYLILEKGLGPIEALRASWDLSEGKELDLFLLGLILFGIGLVYALVGAIAILPIAGILGVLAAFIKPLAVIFFSLAGILGSLIGSLASPFYLLVYTQVYEKLTKAAPQIEA